MRILRNPNFRFPQGYQLQQEVRGHVAPVQPPGVLGETHASWVSTDPIIRRRERGCRPLGHPSLQ